MTEKVSLGIHIIFITLILNGGCG